MGQPVKLSETLVLDARLAGETEERSIAGQIEFWARLGRSIEMVLRTDDLLRLKRRGEARPLSVCVASIGTKRGRRRLADHLAALPYPHFESAPGQPKLVIKVDRNGTRTLGRFVNRQFRPVQPK